MKKLSIAIDMGAKNTGVFVAKSKNDKIVEKKAFTVILDKSALNFSKISRRNNRHRVRNQKRRKLAKRLLWEILDKNSFFN
jgi:Zn-finger nucleic acid-binding protein